MNLKYEFSSKKKKDQKTGILVKTENVTYLQEDFTKDEQTETSLNATVNDVSVDHSSIKKEHILNIYQYLMGKNNIFQFLEKNIYWIIY